MQRAVLALEHTVIGDGCRIGGERAQLHLAADAMRGADLGHTDAGGQGAPSLEHVPIEWIGICSASFALAHVLIGKPVSTFPKHALALPRKWGREPERAAAHQLAGAAGAVPGAAFAASSCALRSLRGIARTGLLRFSRFMTPAWSRKRSTRSVGSAPLASHALTLSRSSLSRSVFSFGNSGLK